MPSALHCPAPRIRARRRPRLRLLVGCAWIGLVAEAATLAAPAAAAVTAFRIRDMDLRDPHTFFSFLGCRDITDTPLIGFSFNGQLQTDLQTDSNSDGALDLSLLLIFDPADPAGTGGPVLFTTTAVCDTPLAGTTCGPAPTHGTALLSTTQPPAGTCLTSIEGTLRPYAPAVTSTSSPCFFSAPANLVLPFVGGIGLSLISVQIAATFVGSTPVQLTNGLLRGFLTETVANATVFPASVPLFGGQALSALLPGGDPPGTALGCAAYSDKDIGPGGEPGWWMYFNFVASAVDYTGPALAVPEASRKGGGLEVRPNPAIGSANIAFEVAGASEARVAIHDLMGRRIRVLESGSFSPGTHRTTWDGRTASGAAAAAGLYVVRVRSGERVSTRSFMLVR